MADVKISELPAATFVGSPDIVPIVQAGATKKAAVTLFQSFLKFIGLDFTGNNLTFMNGAIMWKSTGDSTHPYTPTTAGIIVKDASNAEVWRLWADAPGSSDNLFFGRLAGDITVTTNTGSQNIGIGAQAFKDVATIGQQNTGIGWRVFGERSVIGHTNTLIGSNARLSGENVDNAVGVGDGLSIGSNSVALGSGAEAGGNFSITIGPDISANDDDQVSIGGTANSPHTATVGSDTVTDFFAGGSSANAIFHGKGDAIVFPDSDPHIIGAAYWLAGALHRSAG